MWLILQNDRPDDFVIATGEQHSVREFCTLAFKYAGLELRFEGEGEHEKGIDAKTGRVSTCGATRRRPGVNWGGIRKRPRLSNL